ncbi:MAG: 3-keto-5-aminohexanoate cleavage protein [Desulfatiglandales bacterium]|nr:3-keto-5-aminohexanoate cleavage protein [Desulfatiglandales bacterium]
MLGPGRGAILSSKTARERDPNLTQEERINGLKAGPEMASLNMRSMMRTFGQLAGTPWPNMSHEIEMYVSKMKKIGVKPEMEVYSHAMFREVNETIKKGLVKKFIYINLVLGMRYQGRMTPPQKF